MINVSESCMVVRHFYSIQNGQVVKYTDIGQLMITYFTFIPPEK